MKKLLMTALFTLAASALAQPTVLVSINPYYDLLRQITGELATVIRILPPGAAPETFDPRPGDLRQMTKADLVVLNGGLDEWLKDLVAASGSKAPVFEVLSELDFEPVMSLADGEVAAPVGHEGVNPHVWLDPLLMAKLVPKLVAELELLDPANAEAYRGNGAALVADLELLNAELQDTLAGVRGAAFVPFHDAWPYFARRFGLDLVIEIEPSPGREPSPSYLLEAIKLIQSSGAKAIFAESQLPARPAEVVAESAGVALYVLEVLGGTAATKSYQDLLRYDAKIIAEALGD